MRISRNELLLAFGCFKDFKRKKSQMRYPLLKSNEELVKLGGFDADPEPEPAEAGLGGEERGGEEGGQGWKNDFSHILHERPQGMREAVGERSSKRKSPCEQVSALREQGKSQARDSFACFWREHAFISSLTEVGDMVANLANNMKKEKSAKGESF